MHYLLHMVILPAVFVSFFVVNVREVTLVFDSLLSITRMINELVPKEFDVFPSMRPPGAKFWHVLKMVPAKESCDEDGKAKDWNYVSAEEGLGRKWRKLTTRRWRRRVVHAVHALQKRKLDQ